MLKMLPAAGAWRLGGTLLGDAVVCEQRTPLWQRLAPAGVSPGLPPTAQTKTRVHSEPISPAPPTFTTGGYSPTAPWGARGRTVEGPLPAPHLGRLKNSLPQSSAPWGGCWPNFPS